MDAGLFQLHPFGTRRAPHSHQHNVGFYGGGVALAVVVNEELLFLRFDGRDSSLIDELYSCFFERRTHALHQVGIKVGQHFFAEFKYGDFTAKSGEDGSKLHPDDPAADDDQTLWDVVDVQHFGRGEYVGQVCSGNGEELGGRARCNDDVGR